jgi:microsomal dipeptidase-like Zn-dependent dipeptidase
MASSRSNGEGHANRRLSFNAFLKESMVEFMKRDQSGDDETDFHRSIVTVDAHIDIRDGFNSIYGDAGEETIDQFDLPKLRRGALDVAVVSLFVDPMERTEANIAKANEILEKKYSALRQFVDSHAKELGFVRTSEEIIQNCDDGKISILLSALNALPFGENLSAFEEYFDKGVRIFGFVHAQNTPFADSSRPATEFGDVPGEGGGITELGADAIKLLNRLGAVVDVAQMTTEAVLQAVEISKTPVIASHSAPRSRVDAPRNISNEEMVKIAEAGGVVHVVPFSPWIKGSSIHKEHYYGQIFKPVGLPSPFDPTAVQLDPAKVLSDDEYKAYSMAYLSFSRNTWRYSDLDDYIDAIETVVNLVGVDHVGIGSDFNHGGGVYGFANVGEAPNVTERLLRRGFSKSDIAKIWGENFLRVLRTVEQHAGR